MSDESFERTLNDAPTLDDAIADESANEPSAPPRVDAADEPEQQLTTADLLADLGSLAAEGIPHPYNHAIAAEIESNKKLAIALERLQTARTLSRFFSGGGNKPVNPWISVVGGLVVAGVTIFVTRRKYAIDMANFASGAQPQPNAVVPPRQQGQATYGNHDTL